MRTSDLSFAVLREMLLDLGFREQVLPSSHLAYFHKPSGAFFGFRPYKLQDKVTEADLLLVRGQLDMRGLMDAAEFDALLLKASA